MKPIQTPISSLIRARPGGGCAAADYWDATELDATQLPQLRDLREAIRALLQANAGHPGPTRAQHRLLTSVTDRASCG